MEAVFIYLNDVAMISVDINLDGIKVTFQYNWQFLDLLLAMMTTCRLIRRIDYIHV